MEEDLGGDIEKFKEYIRRLGKMKQIMIIKGTWTIWSQNQRRRKGKKGWKDIYDLKFIISKIYIHINSKFRVFSNFKLHLQKLKF